MISPPTLFLRVLAWLLVVLGGLTPGTCDARARREPTLAEGLLKSAVQRYVQSRPVKDSRPMSYSYSFVDLAAKGTRQAIVYLAGEGWCGTGGCTTLILTKEGSSYKIISHIPATRLPCRLLETKSHGWHDLAFWRSGGGILPYEERLQFDGEGYWWSSSDVQGARKVEDMKGKVILSSKSREAYLYR